MRLKDPGAFELLTQMEGDAWAELQRRRPQAPHSFFYMLTAWQAKVEQGYEHDALTPIQDFMDGSGSNVIYGDGGWRRYQVCSDGEIVLLRESAREESCARAVALGIRVPGY